MSSIHAARVAGLLTGLVIVSVACGADLRRDTYGDPLPPGALARMGTLRWRHGGPVTFVGFTNGGKQIVTACTDGYVRVWDLVSGRIVRRFGKARNNDAAYAVGGGTMNFSGANHIALSRDGNTLAAQDPLAQLRVWDVRTGKEIPTLPAGDGSRVRRFGISGIALSPDGKLAALGGADQKIRIMEVGSGKEPRAIGKVSNQPFRFGGNNAVVFLDDGKSVACSYTELENQKTVSLVRVYDVESGKQLREIRPEENNNRITVGGLSVSPNRKVLAWTGPDGVTLYDAATGTKLGRLSDKSMPNRGFPVATAFSPDSQTIATRSGNDGPIVFWNVASGKEIGRVSGSGDPRAFGGGGFGHNFAFSPDGETLIEATAGNTVRLWNVATRKEMDLGFGGHRGPISQQALSSDGKLLTTFAADHTIRQWDLKSGRESRHIDLPADTAIAAITPDGTRAAIGAMANNTIRLWDVAAGKETGAVTVGGAQRGFANSTGALALTPDGRRLAVRGVDQSIRLYDVESGKEVAVVNPTPKSDPRTGGPVFYGGLNAGVPLLFARDGTTVASAANAGQSVLSSRIAAPSTSVLLWRVSARRPRHVEAPSENVLSLTFSPDGRTLASFSSSRAVSLVDVLTGKQYAHFELGSESAKPMLRGPGVFGFGTPTGLAISTDSRMIAVADGSEILLLDMENGEVLGKLSGHQAGVQALAFAADNQTLISSSADTTSLVWDVRRFLKAPPKVAVEWTDVLRGEQWKDLAGEPAKALKAMRLFDAAPQEAVALFHARLQPAVGVDPARIEQLVVELDSDQFPVRRKATEELDKLGELAQPALEKALKQSPSLETQRRLEKLLDKVLGDEPPSAEVQRSIRALQILEKLGTAEARQLIQAVAGGAAGHRLTRYAEAALKRMGNS